MAAYPVAAPGRPPRRGYNPPMRTMLATTFVLVLCAAPATAAETLLAIPGDGRALLRSGAGHVMVETEAGARPLAHGAASGALRQLAGDARHWWAVGTTPSEGGGSRLLLISGGEEPGNAPAPATRAPRVHAPTLLVAAGSEAVLHGVAWLEGERHGRFAVKAARWADGAWGEPETVAPAPPVGSRVSLSGAVLADGTWLLAWSAFDGFDDEIWWTRRGSEGWTAPQRVGVDDEVPDVTPVLRAAGDGALLAWSEYDGRNYRLRLARFDGEDFRAAGTLGGRGGTFPRFDGTSAEPRLLHRDVEGGGWSLVTLAENGKVLRRATVAGAGAEPPAVAADADGVTFQWLDGGAVKSTRAAWSAVR